MTTGKWIEEGVPHRGWVCLDITDIGFPSGFICEMCEVMEIRYVHHMAHEHYPLPLDCGCICAGHMEEDLERAQLREKLFKARQSRRKNWLERKWRRSWRGADFLNTDGFHIAVWAKGDGTYAALVRNRASENTRYSQRKYFSADAAKLAAFDAMIGWREPR